jgi:hypothetical protein
MVRAVMFVAAAVMLAVYVIPHSLRGSELDYDEMQVETGWRGADPGIPFSTGGNRVG